MFVVNNCEALNDTKIKIITIELNTNEARRIAYRVMRQEL
jgi:hypothetical protein